MSRKYIGAGIPPKPKDLGFLPERLMKKLRQLSEQIMENINQFIEDAENNDSPIEESVEDMKKQIQVAKGIIATAIADEQKLIRAYREAIDAANRCEHRINTLLQNNNEQHANEIRLQGKKYQELAHDLEKRIRAQEMLIEELKVDLSEIYEQFRSTSSRVDALFHQQKQAKTRAEFQKILAEFDLIDVNTTSQHAEHDSENAENEITEMEEHERKNDEPNETTQKGFNIDEALADLKKDILGSSQND